MVGNNSEEPIPIYDKQVCQFIIISFLFLFFKREVHGRSFHNYILRKVLRFTVHFV